MNRRIIALVCALALLLAACGAQPDPDEATGTAYNLYFTSGAVAGAALVSEERRLPAGPDDVERLTEALLLALLSGPASTALAAPVPSGTRLLGWSLDEEARTLTVDFSEQYAARPGVDLTLADYSVALTLCQLPGVESVSITVEGQPVPFRDYHLLRASDVILSGSEGAPVYYTATLYFPSTRGGLGAEQRDLLITETDTLASVLLSALLAGPLDEGLRPSFPVGTQVLSTSIDAGICYADLSTPFVDNAPTDPADAALLLYSIVNTLCTQEEVSTVRLLVDGKSVESYGSVPTSARLEPNFDLISP